MYNSKFLSSKTLSVYSDGCVIINTKPLSLKIIKNFLFFEKDHKLFSKELKNNKLTKKKVAYRNKIF